MCECSRIFYGKVFFIASKSDSASGDRFFEPLAFHSDSLLAKKLIARNRETATFEQIDAFPIAIPGAAPMPLMVNEELFIDNQVFLKKWISRKFSSLLIHFCGGGKSLQGSLNLV